MTNDEANAWIYRELNVSRETFAALARFADLVAHEAKKQNLVSAATLDVFWVRHILDSAQLIKMARSYLGDATLRWVDVGSGAGIPGVIIAIVTAQPIVLIEPRAQRARFLAETVETLRLGYAEVFQGIVQSFRGETFDVITARAVASLPKMVAIARHLSNADTIWLLPKGRSARSELESMSQACQSAWVIEDSVTEPGSGILVGKGISLDSAL